MFNRYWRIFPWGMQLLMFLLTLFTLFSFGSLVMLTLVPKAFGVSMNDLTQLSTASQPLQIRAGLTAQSIAHAFSFAIPGFIFAGFTHPRLREYLGLRAPGHPMHWLLVTGMMLALMPVFLWGEAWSIQHLHFGAWADQMQHKNDDTIATFLKLNTGGDLVFLLFALAFLPALGEEVIFRGILLRLLHRLGLLRSRQGAPSGKAPDAQMRMASPILFSSLAFALIHFNPYGFVFIFIAGCVLAFVYYLTGSLLCSMWAHLLYNGTQVLAIFFLSGHGPGAAQSNELPDWTAIAGLIVFAFCFYFLIKKQSPLPPDWSDDFRGETPPGTGTQDSNRNPA